MDRAAIKEFLKSLLGPNVPLKDQGEWVSTNCLLAKWRHARGTDRNMSFGVRVSEDTESVFNCFTCKAAGPLTSLLDRLESYTGEDYRELKKEVREQELFGLNVPEWGARKRRTRAAKLGEPVSDDMLDIYDPAAGHPYLRKRHIDNETAEYLRLCVDHDNHGAERILFPVFSPSGGFYGYTGRATEEGVEPRIRDYFGLPKRLLLLGSHLLKDGTDKYLILVEGLFDYARLVSYAEPAIAVMHSSITEAQTRVLKELSRPIYVFFDNDKAGKEGALQVGEKLGRHVPVFSVTYTRGAKDPAMLQHHEVRKMIQGADLM